MDGSLPFKVYKEMTIYIEKKSFKNFISLRELDNYQVVLVLFIIHHSTTGKASYVYLDKLHFLFDLAICNRNYREYPKYTIPHWKVDKELKRKLIILTNNDIILQCNKEKVRFSLSEKGNNFLKSILEVDDFYKLNTKIAELCNSISHSDFEKSRSIFSC